MNIGSEVAAVNAVFIFSLIESCKLNDINPQDYLRHLFECIFHGRDGDRKVLLPCIIEINIKTKLFSYSFFFIDCFTADKVNVMENRKFTKMRYIL